jgi:hypothetical protein
MAAVAICIHCPDYFKYISDTNTKIPFSIQPYIILNDLMRNTLIDLDCRSNNTEISLLNRSLLLSAKLLDYQPCRPNCSRPKCEVPVHRPNLSEYSHARDTIANRLPRALTASQQRRVSNDLPFVYSKVANDEVQEKVIELKACSQEDEDCESTAEAWRYPIVSWLGRTELGDEYRGPDPPCALENCERPERATSANTQRDAGAVEISAK